VLFDLKILEFFGIKFCHSNGRISGFGHFSLVNVVRYAGRGLYDGPIPHPRESYGVCLSLSVMKCNNHPRRLR
jgi:hypothetical protein